MNAETPPVSGVHYVGGICQFLFAAIRRRFLLLLVAPVLAAAIGYAATFAMTPVYEGYMTIQSGKVAGAPLQTIQSIVDRVSSPTFKSSVLRSLNFDISKDPTAALIYQSLAPRAMTPNDPAPDIVEVSARGYRKEEIAAALRAISDLIAQQQADIARTRLGALEAKLTQTEDEIARLNTDKKTLTDTLARANTGKTVEAPSVEPTAAQLQLRQMIEEADKAIAKARQGKIDLTEDISPQQTFVARKLDDIFISPVPVYPRRLYTAGLVWTCAFVLCLVLAIATAPNQREAV
jgi:hypothetical protein